MPDRNKIKPRRSYTANSVPLTTDLETHEMAVRWTSSDPAIFTKDAAGQIVTVPLGGGGGGGGSGSTSLVYAATPSAFPATGSADNLYIATDTQRVFRWASSVYVEVGPLAGGGSNWVSVPTLPNSTGSAGDLAYDGSYVYLATGANAWRRVALPAWDVPTSIAGLQLWLDAADSSTLYDATSGGSLVAADGSIARWVDKSGQGNHAIQATSGSQPTRRTAGLNSLPSVQFVADDADNGDWLGIAHAALLNGSSSGLAVFCVYKTATTGTNRGLAGKWPGVGQNTGPAWLLGYTGGSSTATTATMYAHDGTNAATRATTSNFNDGTARLLGYVNTTAGLQARMNGVLEGTNTSTYVVNQSSTAGVVIGGYCGYGLSSGQALMSAHISEFLIYSGALSSGDVSAIESYLMSKWGIT